jgi:hypothetical protein
MIMLSYRTGPITLKIQMGLTLATRYAGTDIIYNKGAVPSNGTHLRLLAAESSVFGT